MQQADALKGDIRLKWYEDGRFEFHLPADGMIAYAMLAAAQDEIHERMMARKAEHKKAQRLVTVPKDGSLTQPEWGR